jgi:hypothetical protein
MPQQQRRRIALNKGCKIEWREIDGGQICKASGRPSSFERGVTEIGSVFHNLQAAHMRPARC